MARKELYTIRTKSDTGFEVLKCDLDFNPSGKYNVNYLGRECDCFASNKPTCRHRQMVALYREGGSFKESIDKGMWYEYDRERWVQGPVNEE